MIEKTLAILIALSFLEGVSVSLTVWLYRVRNRSDIKDNIREIYRNVVKDSDRGTRKHHQSSVSDKRNGAVGAGTSQVNTKRTTQEPRRRPSRAGQTNRDVKRDSESNTEGIARRSSGLSGWVPFVGKNDSAGTESSPYEMAKELATRARNGEFNGTTKTPDHTPPIAVAAEKFADSSPKYTDTVGKFKQTLAQDDTDPATIVDHLEDVTATARGAESLSYELESNEWPASLDLETDISIVQQVSKLLEEYNNLHEDHEDLQNSISDMEAEMAELQKQNDQLQTSLNECEERESIFRTNILAICRETSIGLDDQEQAVQRAEQLAKLAKKGRIDVPHGAIAAEQVLNDESVPVTSQPAKELLTALQNTESPLEELKQVVYRLNAAVTTQQRLDRVDRDEVRTDAERLRTTANGLEGVAPDAISTEIDDRLLRYVNNADDKAPVFAASRTLSHFESVLETIDKRRGVNQSVEELIDEVAQLDENVGWFIKNRPYNHEIPKYIKSNILKEVHTAKDLAASGEVERAIGRLQVAVTVFELLKDIYNEPEYNTVLEIGAQ